MIMAGSRTATILAIQTISIHGTIMVDVSSQISSEATPRNAASVAKPSTAIRWEIAYK